MAFVAMFGAHADRMPLEKHAGVALFVCMGDHSGGGCGSWEATGGCNAAFFVDAKTMKGKSLASPPSGPKGPPKTLRAKRFAYKETFELDPETENPEDGGYSIHSKLAGYPDWVQRDESIPCATCKKPMKFRAQLSDGLDPAMNFGFGVGYLFTCESEHAAAFMWQR